MPLLKLKFNVASRSFEVGEHDLIRSVHFPSPGIITSMPFQPCSCIPFDIHEACLCQRQKNMSASESRYDKSHVGWECNTETNIHNVKAHQDSFSIVLGIRYSSSDTSLADIDIGPGHGLHLGFPCSLRASLVEKGPDRDHPKTKERLNNTLYIQESGHIRALATSPAHAHPTKNSAPRLSIYTWHEERRAQLLEKCDSSRVGCCCPLVFVFFRLMSDSSRRASQASSFRQYNLLSQTV